MTNGYMSQSYVPQFEVLEGIRKNTGGGYIFCGAPVVHIECDKIDEMSLSKILHNPEAFGQFAQNINMRIV